MKILKINKFVLQIETPQRKFKFVFSHYLRSVKPVILNSSKIIFLILLINFCFIFPALAQGTQAQTNLADSLININEDQINSALDKQINLIDKNFLSMLEQKALTSLSKENYDYAYRYALIADIAALKIKKEDNYRIGLAVFYARFGNPDNALKICNIIALEKPDHPMLNTAYGIAYENKGDFRNSALYFEKTLQKEPRNVQLLEHLLLAYKALNQKELSTVIAKKILELDPKNEAADIVLKEDKNSGKNNMPDEFEYLVHLRQADQYMASGQLDNALTEYQAVVTLEPRYTDAYLKLGLLYLNKKMYDEARINFEKALALEPSNSRTCFLLGVTYEDIYDTKCSVADLDKAIEYYKKSLEIDSTFTSAQQNLNRAQAKRK